MYHELACWVERLRHDRLASSYRQLLLLLLRHRGISAWLGGEAASN